jgi:hypothetical protein
VDTSRIQVKNVGAALMCSVLEYFSCHFQLFLMTYRLPVTQNGNSFRSSSEHKIQDYRTTDLQDVPFKT